MTQTRAFPVLRARNLLTKRLARGREGATAGHPVSGTIGAAGTAQRSERLVRGCPIVCDTFGHGNGSWCRLSMQLGGGALRREWLGCRICIDPCIDAGLQTRDVTGA